MNVEFTVLKRTFDLHKAEYEEAVMRALSSGWYILGQEMQSFEEAFSGYLGVKHCIALNSGTDALILGIRALGIGVGDEVIVPASTYIASVIGITENGATPVFVDVDECGGIDSSIIEKAITERTKAILPVHLYGQPCEMDKVKRIADDHGLFIIEDCAQSHGAKYKGQLTGTFGTLGCFSFYPTKPLGAMGDAGAVVTNDSILAERLRMLRNYGSKVKYHNEINGVNSRMDEVQAAVLGVGLKYLEEGNRERIRIAERYKAGISNEQVKILSVRDESTHVYHLFPVLCDRRDEVKDYLESEGIKTQIHYPTPPYVADCYKDWGYKWSDYPMAERFSKKELSLPIYAGMPEDEVDRVIETVNGFER